MAIDTSGKWTIKYKVFKIGKLSLTLPCILSPLAGISDLPFRMLNRSFGCELAFTEMISARALVYQSSHTLRMLSTLPEDRPLGVQLLGNNPDILRKALDMLQKYKFDLIDFNAACPVSKVTGRGEGAGLLKNPEQLKELLRVLVNNSLAPVTLKIRTGWDGDSVNARTIALVAQEAGIMGLFIHGRTRAQGYSGKVDYKTIGEIKSALKIPVIASGDALSAPLIKKIFTETGCDAVAIGRGSFGNPWIFRETAQYLRTGIIPARPGLGEIADTMCKHLSLCLDYYGETAGILLFRKFFGWYTKGFQEMKPLKEMAFHAETREQMTELIEKLSPGHAICPVNKDINTFKTEK